LLVAGVLIMNVMLVAVSQRTSEIGLLKALGARRQQILVLFIAEAMSLSILGATAGLIVGNAGTFVMRAAFPAIDFAAPVWAMTAAFGTAIVSGLVFGILPASRAAKLDPVHALAGR